ncbi:MAG: hypothetical protein Kow0079_11210 [Vicingaceae bacterium]
MNFNKKIVAFLFLLHSFHLYSTNALKFIENKGQWDKNILLKAHLGNGALFLEKNKLTYNFYNANEYKFHHFNLHKNNTKLENKLRFHAFNVEFLNCLKNPIINSSLPFPEYYNFIKGKNPDKWTSNVKAFEVVEYKELYNGIDLKLYSYLKSMKYDFIVKPNANVKDIQLKFKGIDEIFIDKNGFLNIITSVNTIQEQKPYAYQIINGKKIEVECKFNLKNNVVSFVFPNGYNKDLTLIIDPILIFGSYSGSYADNFGMTATFGYDGSLFAGGTTFGVGYPTTTGAFDTLFNGTPAQGITDIVISRYDSTGTTMIYSTYIGGTQAETVHSLIANTQNELYIYGVTSSNDFPVTPNAYDTTFNGGSYLFFPNNGTKFNNGTDIYLAKLNATGTSLLGCTYLGGSSNDGVNHKFTLTGNANLDYDSLMNNYGDQYRGEVMLDKYNNCYIASSTHSNDFPIVNGFDNTLNGHQDAVIAKFSDDLSTLIWSSYLGGTNADAGYSIKVDSSLTVYVSGGTTSNDFPATPTAYNNTFQGGKADGFLVKIDSNGSNILSATYYGTNNYDQCYFLEIDKFGSIYTVGQTRGTITPTPGVYSNPGSGVFITKFNNNLDTIFYETVVGNGSVNTYFSPSAFLVDRCQNVYVSGWGGNILGGSPMTNMPVTSNAFQSSSGDGFNFYLIVLERDAASQLYGTYFGGGQSQEHVDGGTSRFDKNGIVYQSVCAGCWGNSDFPTTPGAWSNTNNSNFCNNGVFKFDFEIVPKAKFTVDQFDGCAPLTITFTNSSNSTTGYLWDFGNGDTTSQDFNPVRTFTTPGTYQVILSITDSICGTKDTAVQNIIVRPEITVTAGPDTATCDTAYLFCNTTGGATQFIWSTNNQFSDTLNNNLSDSTLTIVIDSTMYIYVEASAGGCSAYDSILVTYNGVNITTVDGASCLGSNAQIEVIDLNNQTLTYQWTPTNTIVSGANGPIAQVNPDSNTTYYISVQNQYGCWGYDSAFVGVSGFNPANINVYADQDTLFNGEGTYLHVEPSTGFTYLWFPPTNLSSTTSPNPYTTTTSTTTYIVTLTDSSGCQYQKMITIYAWEILCGEPEIFVPNAFTPNGDGENDKLFVRGINVDEMNFQIFDRWGEKVFETYNQKIGWDGTFKGELVEPGVFVYHLTVKCVDGQDYFKKGNVTVIR